jgi:hypothetical protein
MDEPGGIAIYRTIDTIGVGDRAGNGHAEERRKFSAAPLSYA